MVGIVRLDNEPTRRGFGEWIDRHIADVMLVDQRGQDVGILSEIAVMPVDGLAEYRQVAAQHGFLGTLHGAKVTRHRDGQQHSDDGHDHQQFDQGESASTNHDTPLRSTPFPAPAYRHRTHRPPAAGPTADSCSCAVPTYRPVARWCRDSGDRAARAAENTT